MNYEQFFSTCNSVRWAVLYYIQFFSMGSSVPCALLYYIQFFSMDSSVLWAVLFLYSVQFLTVSEYCPLAMCCHPHYLVGSRSSTWPRALHCNTLHCTAVHLRALHYTALHCSVVQFSAVSFNIHHLVLLHCHVHCTCTEYTIDHFSSMAHSGNAVVNCHQRTSWLMACMKPLGRTPTYTTEFQKE